MKRSMLILCAVALVAGMWAPAGAGPTPGGFTTDNVEYVGFVPFEQATSTGLTIQGKYMYLTSWKNISVYDISDPVSPELLDTAPLGFKFENEDVALSPDGDTLLFSESLPNDALHVWNVEDKSNIQEIATLEGAGDHTTSCILKCKWAYGSDGTISDLRNPAKPKLAAARDSKKSWHARTGLNDDGAHDVEEFRNGFLITSTISDPFQWLDVRKPLRPKVIARGKNPDPAGFLFHSGHWPNGGRARFVLMQGERNFNPRCSDSNGPFMTFDSRRVRRTRTFKLKDTYRLGNGTYSDGKPAVNALGCSAHWFDEHPKYRNGGLVALGYYEHGTRFLDIKRNGKIKEVGWFVPYGGSTSAAYWVNKDIVYAVDYTRGLDILRFHHKHM
jgi:hypothetical protein